MLIVYSVKRVDIRWKIPERRNWESYYRWVHFVPPDIIFNPVIFSYWRTICTKPKKLESSNSCIERSISTKYALSYVCRYDSWSRFWLFRACDIGYFAHKYPWYFNGTAHSLVLPYYRGLYSCILDRSIVHEYHLGPIRKHRALKNNAEKLHRLILSIRIVENKIGDKNKPYKLNKWIHW